MPYKLDNIKSGDLLVWTGDDVQGKSNFYLKLVRLATISDYGHVSIAWRKDDQLYHVEATQPRIWCTRIDPVEPFYSIPMNLDVPDDKMHGFFHDKLGLDYSFIDAICGYLGITLRDENRWQCVELAVHFYRYLGLDFGNKYVPNKFIKNVMSKTGHPLVRHGSVSF